MTGFAVLVFMVSFAVGLVAERLLRSSERKYYACFPCTTGAPDDPNELRRKKLRRSVQLWFGILLMAAALATVSWAYLMWHFFIKPALLLA